MASVHSSHHSSRLGATTGAFTTSTLPPVMISHPSPQITTTYPVGMTVTAQPMTTVTTNTMHTGTLSGTATIGGHTIQGSLHATGGISTLPMGTITSTTHGVYSTTPKGDMTPQAMIAHLPHTEGMAKADIDNAYFGETRKVSSVVLEQQVIGTMPTQESVRYVDVPTVEEKVKYVTRKEVVEVEKVVPKIIWDTVERVVEKPVITYIDKLVEVPVEQIVEIPEIQVVEVTKQVEIPEYVPKIVYQDKLVEVPGPVVERPKIVHVERTIVKPTAVDKHVPVVVAQTIKPLITESDRSIIVDVLDYEPEVVPVDVHVAKPVNSALELVGQLETRHKLVNITSAQYNSILRSLNAHMDDQMRATLPFIADAGQVNFVPDSNAQYIVAPVNIQIEGYTAPVTQTIVPGMSTLVGASMVGDSRIAITHRDAALSSTHGTIMESHAGLVDGRKVACCGIAGDRQPRTQFLSGEIKVADKSMLEATVSTQQLESTVSQAIDATAQTLGSMVGDAVQTFATSALNAANNTATTSVMRSQAPSTRRSKSTQETHRQQPQTVVMGSSYEVPHQEGGSIRSHIVSTAAGPRSRVCC